MLTFKIYPNLGASIHGLKFKNQTIINDIHGADDLENVKAYYKSSLLFPFPNRLEFGRFTHDNEEYELPKNDQGKHAIHGCIANAIFEVSRIQENEITLSYSHLSNKKFPFSFKFQIRYIATETGVQLHFSITNTDTKSFPFGIGWHPYFVLNDINTAQVFFDADKEFITNKELIPTGSKRHESSCIVLKEVNLDTAYQLTNDTIALHTSDYQAIIKVPSNSYLQAYIPNSRRSIALEPMSCLGNAFNNEVGVQTIQPANTWNWIVTMDLSIAEM